MKKPLGLILYDGPSLINGKRIIMIATGFKRKSRNKKTGNMIQSWILCADKPPMDANRCGDDIAVCSTCKHRHFRSCYVNLAHGPHHVYEAWKKGSYTTMNPDDPAIKDLFLERYLRVGSYGEPTAIPASIWKSLTKHSKGWCGYSHRWKTCSTDYRKFCMASCDTEEEVLDALCRNWRPFYVRQEGDHLLPRFFVCPASKEAGRKTNCNKCGGCKGGTASSRGTFPTIIAHGPSWKTIFFARGMKRFKNKKRYVGVAWDKSPVKK